MPGDAIDLLFDWEDEREADREEEDPQPQPDARLGGRRRHPWPPRKITEGELASSPTRTCTKCGETYPEKKEFYRWHKQRRCYATQCRGCDRRDARKWHQREVSRRDPFTTRWMRIQSRSRQRGIEWGYDNPEDLREFWDTPCHYCGGEVTQRLGLDRVDSERGYIPGNVVQCCLTCNHMKMSHSVDEWTAHMEKVLEHLGREDD